MIDGRRVLAVVPARGGSKGIPLKNLLPIGGIPLVTLAGQVATEVREIDRAVVSTDHAEIAEAAKCGGLDVPFMRPAEISGDRVGDLDVLRHALLATEEIDLVTYDIILMLQPTSPNRTAAHIKRTLERLVEGKFDAVWTVSETDSKAHPLKQLRISGEGKLDYYDPAGSQVVARQQLAPVFHRNGVAYAMTRDCLVGQSSIKGDNCGAVILDEPLANIDTELDLAWAEFLRDRANDVPKDEGTLHE